MSAVLVGVKYKSDKRDQYLHHGGWLVKLGLWLLFCAMPFFFPVGLINAYCESFAVSLISTLDCRFNSRMDKLLPNVSCSLHIFSYTHASIFCGSCCYAHVCRALQHGWLDLALAYSWWFR